MSYSLIGHFVDVKNKRIFFSGDVSFLKNLDCRRYSAQFSDITATGGKYKDNFQDIIVDYVIDFENYYDKEILDNPEIIKGLISGYKPESYKPSERINYVVDETFLKEHKSVFEEYKLSPSIEETLNGFENNENVIPVYLKKKTKVEGLWYKASDFEDAKDKIYKEYEEARKKVEKLESIKYTKEWFEWTEEGRGNLLEELSWANSDLEDKLWQKESLDKMLNILDFLKEDLGYRVINQWGQTRYKWNYDEPREIEIFIEVC